MRQIRDLAHGDGRMGDRTIGVPTCATCGVWGQGRTGVPHRESVALGGRRQAGGEEGRRKDGRSGLFNTCIGLFSSRISGIYHWSSTEIDIQMSVLFRPKTTDEAELGASLISSPFARSGPPVATWIPRGGNVPGPLPGPNGCSTTHHHAMRHPRLARLRKASRKPDHEAICCPGRTRHCASANQQTKASWVGPGLAHHQL